MAPKFFSYAFLALFSLQLALSLTPPESSPSPSPESAADSSPFSSPPSPSSPSPSSPSLSPETGSPTDSPISSPPSDLLPPGTSPTPANSPDNSITVPSPAPAPNEASDINHIDNAEAGGDEENGSSGMSGGKKAGIAVGVVVAAGAVGLAGLVYKKRQENIRRSALGYAARREFL